MRRATHEADRRLVVRAVALASLLLLAGAATLAGGPWRVRGDGTAMKWTGPVPYHLDPGDLGSLSHAVAASLVADALLEWESVGVLTFTPTPGTAGTLLPDDINAAGTQSTNPAHYLRYWGRHDDGWSPIIFDADGSIVDDMFGEGASEDILGAATIDTKFIAGPSISEATIVLNGALIDGVAPDVASLAAYKAIIVHEIGHYLNLDHSALNGELAEDGDPANDIYIPSMYPFAVEDDSSISTLNPDDERALLGLYQSVHTESIDGVVKAGEQHFQGAQVVAREVGDPLMSAYSFISGGHYFPCNPGSTCDPCAGETCNDDPVAKGRYRLVGIPPGNYTVCVEQIDTRLNQAAGTSVGPLVEPAVLPGPEECHDAAESHDPQLDDPDELTIVAVSGHATGIDILLDDLPVAGVDADPHEPNNVPGEAAFLLAPSDTTYGLLESMDLDFFRFSVGAGDRVRVDIEARELGSTLDALIVLYDDTGQPIDTVDDAFDGGTRAFSLDPWTEEFVSFSGDLTIVVTCYPDFLLQGCATASALPYWLRIEVEPDTDGDGTVDRDDVCPDTPSNDEDRDQLCDDNCPDVSNPAQVDSDGDGSGNACDNCPGQSNPNQADQDGDATGDVCDVCPGDPLDDDDGDGYCADQDNCPSQHNPAQLPTPDADGDGILDDCDRCPLDSDPLDLDTDGDGVGDACDLCPGEAPDDVDGDGVCAGAGFRPPMDGQHDNCPSVANSGQFDGDGDGVGNGCDNCPAVPNPTQVNSDGDEYGNACDDDAIGPPRVFQVFPADGSIDVPVGDDIVLWMTRSVRPGTVGPSSIVVDRPNGEKVDAAYRRNGDTVIAFDPDNSLVPDALYRINVSSPLADLAGNLVEPFTASFRTAGAAGTIGTGGIGDDAAGTTLTGRGSSVAMLKDVDGDGFDDFIYGSPAEDGLGRTGAGTATLVFGGPTLFDGGATTSIDFVGEAAMMGAGAIVARAGDVNEDGHEDFMIAAPTPGPGLPSTVYIVFGDPGWRSADSVQDLGLLTSCTGDPPCGVVLWADQGERAGASVSFAGDLDSDGSDDVLIGAPGGTPGFNRAEAGKVYLVWGPLSDGATIHLPDIGAAGEGLIFHGENAGDLAGQSVSLWPDSDLEDDDLIIGAPGAATPDPVDDPIPAAGFVYSILGGTDLEAAAYPSGVIELSRVARPPDEIAGVVYFGFEVGGEIGHSTTGGVDLDGDGLPEVIFAGDGIMYVVPADGPKIVSRTSNAGRPTSVSPGGTTIQKGPQDDPRTPGQGHIYGDFGASVFIGPEGANLGRLKVAGAGDVNGDGLEDLVIGAPDAASGPHAVVVYGRQGGWPEEVLLSEVGTSVPGFRVTISSGSGGELLGQGVGGGSDVNGDGVDDLVIGAPDAGTSGQVHVLSLRRPAEVGNVELSSEPAGTRLSWMRPWRATRYNVYRGVLGELRGQSNVLTSEMTSVGACRGPELSSTDSSTPAANEGFYYLVTAVNANGEGRLGPMDPATPPRRNDQPCRP